MSIVTAEHFLELVSARRGHFRIESGYHAALWLDLDPLFSSYSRISPFVAQMVRIIRPHNPSVICGPLLGGAFLAQLVAETLDVEFVFTNRVAPSGSTGMFAVEYSLPKGLRATVPGERVAIVDDVMSAGSAMRGTYDELRRHNAEVVAVGSLLVLGSKGSDFFEACGIPVKAVTRQDYETWPPDDCPLCREGVDLVDAYD